MRKERLILIIKEITIYGYGKWVDQHFEFTNPVQVIYGPNEAGKSTMIDFIISVFFGFQNKRQAVHGQYFPKNSNAYGGEILFTEQGVTYRLTRTAGTHGGKITFYDVTNEETLSEADLQKILGPLDRGIYTSFFYFGEMDQQAFYKMRLADLRSRIQQIGISNANDWFDLQAELQKKADKLYMPRGKKPVINQQLREYDQLVEKVAAARDKFPQYDQQTIQVEQLLAQRKQTDQQIADLQTEVQRYQRLEQVTPLVAEKEQLLKELEQLKEQVIPAEAVTKIQKLTSESDNLTDQLVEMKADNKPAETDKELLNFLSQNQATIDKLKEQLDNNLDLSSQATFLEQEINAKKMSMDANLARLGFTEPDLPIPFEADKITEISNVISGSNSTSHNSRVSQQSKSSVPLVGLSLGAVLFLIGLFTQLSWLTVLALFVIGGAGYSWWHTKASDSSAVSNSDQDRINQISRQYHLAGVPVERWLSIQSDLREVVSQQSEIKRQTNQLDQIKEQLTIYLNQWQFARNWLSNMTGDSHAQLGIIQKTLMDWQTRQQSAELAHKQFEDRMNQLQTKQNLLDQKQAELKKYYRQYDVNNELELTNRIKLSQDYQDKQKQLELISNQLASVESNIDTDHLNLDANDVTQKLADLNEQLAISQRLSHEQTKQITEGQTTIQQLVHDGGYYELRQQQANLQADINGNVVQWLAYQSALKWLEATMNIITKGRVPKVLDLTTKYFEILTNHSYSKIVFENSIEVVRQDGTNFAINELSRGTLEQLYFSLVLALAVGFHEDFALPIIIDDGFVNFDGRRKQAAKELLNEIGKQNQVLFYTADVNQLTEFTAEQIINLGQEEIQ